MYDGCCWCGISRFFLFFFSKLVWLFFLFFASPCLLGGGGHGLLFSAYP
jgi:hypothetical protein